MHTLSKEPYEQSAYFFKDIGTYQRICSIEFWAERRSNIWPSSRDLGFSFSVHFKISCKKHNYERSFWLAGYWHISEDPHFCILGWPEIQYGHQAAILYFPVHTLSQEPYEESIGIFYRILAHIRGSALSNLERLEIQYGCQAAILNCLSFTLSQEQIKQLIQIF